MANHDTTGGSREDKLGRNPLYYALGNPVPEEQWESLPLGDGFSWTRMDPKLGLQQSNWLVVWNIFYS